MPVLTDAGRRGRSDARDVCDVCDERDKCDERDERGVFDMCDPPDDYAKQQPGAARDNGHMKHRTNAAPKKA